MSDLEGRASTRRQLLKASAWSVPVIALAVAAPMAAASVVPPSSTARIVWNNAHLSNSGKQLDLGIQFPYIDWQSTVTMVQIRLEVKLPRGPYSGGFSMAQGTNWKPSPVIRATDFYTLPFTFTKLLTQSESTGNFSLLLDTFRPGSGVELVAYGIDSLGQVTKSIAEVLR